MGDDKRIKDIERRSGYPDRRPNEPAEPTAGPEGDVPTGGQLADDDAVDDTEQRYGEDESPA